MKLLGILIFQEDKDNSQQDAGSEGCGYLVGLAFLAGAGWFFYAVASEWWKYSFPAKQILALYYYTIILPMNGLIKGLILPWHFIRTDSLTPYANLNLILAILAVACVGIFYILCLWPLKRCLKIKFVWVSLLTFLLGPWLFWGVWLIYKWLVA